MFGVRDTAGDVCQETALRTAMVTHAFRPAYRNLIDGPPKVPTGIELIRVDDSDVGPILTDAADEVIGRSLRQSKNWEPGEGRYLRSTLLPGMNVIDIGANIGYFTLLMAQIVGPKGHVLAIEPVPSTFTILRSNILLAALDNVDMLPVAACGKSSLLTISKDPINPGGSSAAYIRSDWEKIPVQGVRLDDILEISTPIDFVKIDAEGMDHAAVRGLEESIHRWRPVLLVEFNPWKIEQLGDSPTAVLQYYRDLGFTVRLLGVDAVRLQREAGMDLHDLLVDNLLVFSKQEADLLEHTRVIHFINLVLEPVRACSSRRSQHFG